MMVRPLKELLDRVETWPEEDQEALADYARELEARRTGFYRLTDDERQAIDAARQTDFVPDDELAAYRKRYGV